MSAGFEKTPINGAIMFTAFGLLLDPLELASIVFAVIVLNEHLLRGLGDKKPNGTEHD